MQEKSAFALDDFATFKSKLFQWAQLFEVNLCIDNNLQENAYHKIECIVAVDAVRSLNIYEEKGAFDRFEQFQKEAQSTLFGYFSYDLKNDLEHLESKSLDRLKLPATYFFEPRYIIELQVDKVFINRSTLDALHLFDQINSVKLVDDSASNSVLQWQSSVDKNTYLNQVKVIQNDILEGSVYELNYCRELFAEDARIAPLQTFLKINGKAKAPFSAFLRMGQQYALCFSPERFIQLDGNQLLSQPIKGTVQKAKTKAENERLKIALYNDEKERAENVMIVDLVRNDFARSAETGSIKVDELFGIYEFENIIQMISTVSATKREDVSPIEALKMAYPMGSMTGAPKIKAMELIEQYENRKRGLYSGTIGYMHPNGDFDFNVVIRTLIYDESQSYLSLQVGGAITYDSDPEKEWEETETKAKSILQFLG